MYGMTYKNFALYMINQKHSELDLFLIPFDDIERYEPVPECDREKKKVEKDEGIVGEEVVEMKASLSAQELITQ